jgi:hypothetical protein
LLTISFTPAFTMPRAPQRANNHGLTRSRSKCK